MLIATCTVPEQLRQSLDQHGERIGVPVVIVDWADTQIAPLAALCAFAPDLVATEISNEAGAVARSLRSISSAALETLERDLHAWYLGFSSIRSRSHQRLTEIWNVPREAWAALGQNAAGGAEERRIRRRTVHDALNAWWCDSASLAPAAVVGLDGAGKTWAILAWLIDTKTRLPIVVTIASSISDTTLGESTTTMKQLLANTLYEMTGVRDRQHWLSRLDRLLSRPPDEGPALVVFFDGLNQNTSIPWERRVQILQGAPFSDRVRVIVSTRTHYFERRLHCLRYLDAPATRIAVGLYDLAPGRELDRMLALHGIDRSELHPGVIELARSPRLFKLVVRFREVLGDAGQVTVHRVLWEYGRDTLGTLDQKSLGPDEWSEWLRHIAEKWRNGTRTFSQKTLSETVSEPHLTKNEVYARLSEIMDGSLIIDEAGEFQLDPVLVGLALGAALLAYLNQTAASSFADLESKLVAWLDPISGVDQKCEILRAATSILVEQKKPYQTIAEVLVTSWLQSQNVPESHRRDFEALAPSLLDPLLDAIEHSEGRVHGSARLGASRALRAIPRTDGSALATIVKRSCRWLRTVSREIDPRRIGDEEFEKRRSTRFMERVGRDSSGPITVAGIELELVNHSSDTLPRIVPSIIWGFPLAPVLAVFETAAAAFAVADASAAWDGLRWVCLLNELDPHETETSLRRLSDAVRQRTSEPGLHAGLPSRISALLLWLTGREEDEEVAASIDPDFYRPWSYETDYLRQPDRSVFFPLERRHARLTLSNQALRMQHRVLRVGDLWLDPDLRPPTTFVAEITEQSTHVDVTQLTRRDSRTREDIEFEQLEPALARSAPRTLALLLRSKLQRMVDCPPSSRYWLAIHATDHILLTRPTEANATRMLRLRHRETGQARRGYRIFGSSCIGDC